MSVPTSRRPLTDPAKPAAEPRRPATEPPSRPAAEPARSALDGARPTAEPVRSDPARSAPDSSRTAAEANRAGPDRGPGSVIDGSGRANGTRRGAPPEGLSQAGPLPGNRSNLAMMSDWPPAAPGSPRAQFEQEGAEETSPPPTALPLPRGLSPEDALEDQIRDLEAWATSILRRSRGRTRRFWLSRGTAFLAAAAAVVAGLLGADRVLTAFAAVTALCVAVVAALRVDGSQRPHRRAVRDLRELQNAIKLRWDKVRLSFPDPLSRKRVAHALALLDAIQSKREEIGRYLGASEPTDGLSRPRRAPSP